MPPRKRGSRTAVKEKEMVTTEAPPEQTPEESARKHLRPEDAVFLSDLELEEPPAVTRQRDPEEYVPTMYDAVLERLWQKYQDAGSPPWSMSAGFTAAQKPEDGWYKDRKGIFYSAVVPDAATALKFIKRAARHMGISYRFRTEEVPHPEDPDVKASKIWFAAAPVLKKADGSDDTSAEENGETNEDDSGE